MPVSVLSIDTSFVVSFFMQHAGYGNAWCQRPAITPNPRLRNSLNRETREIREKSSPFPRKLSGFAYFAYFAVRSVFYPPGDLHDGRRGKSPPDTSCAACGVSKNAATNREKCQYAQEVRIIRTHAASRLRLPAPAPKSVNSEVTPASARLRLAWNPCQRQFRRRQRWRGMAFSIIFRRFSLDILGLHANLSA